MVWLFLGACNEPPGAPTVAITPLDPVTTDDLRAVVQGEASDPDGDAVTYTYAWFVDNAERSDLTGDTVPASETTKGDTWKVVVTPADAKSTGTTGDASVVIADTPPEVVLALDPLSPTAADDVTVSPSTSDADDDPVDVAWTWTRDGAAAGLLDPTLPAGTAARGETWEATATPNDGELDGTPQSVSFVVGNALPVVAAITVAPADPVVTDTLTASFDVADADGDAVSLAVTWSVDGVDVQTDAVGEGEVATLSGLFVKGQEVVVTAVPDDGYDEGEPVASDVIVIADSAPSATGARVSPDPVYVDSDVTCVGEGWTDADGDAEAYTTEWTVNGISAGTGDVLAAGTYVRGDSIGCALVPTDGERAGDRVEATPVTVRNSPPACDTAEVTIGEEGVTVEGTATVTEDGMVGCVDADGDAITRLYTWEVDGSVVSADTTLPIAGNAARGQSVTLELATWDGFEVGSTAVSNTLVVANALAEVTALSLSPATVTTDSTVSAAVSTDDADADTVSLTYAWTVDGVPAGSATTLAGSAFAKGQTIVLTVTPSDGLDDGVPSSASVVVDNTPPGAPTVAIAPAPPSVDDDLVCTLAAAAADADGDTLSYTFAWTVDGVAYTSATTTTRAGDTVPASATSAGQAWACSVTASDGTDSGSAATDSVLVGCDLDLDGYDASACSGGTDCDDADAAVNPAATEVCDAADTDEDCDGLADDADSSLSATVYYPDADGDTYGDATRGAAACSQPSGWVTTGEDCDDMSASIHPHASEWCDAADLDEDCDGLADDADSSVLGQTTQYVDADGDAYGGTTSGYIRSCDLRSGYATNHTDCDDTSAAVSPAATEVCNGVDDDCSGDIDIDATDRLTLYEDSDGDGYGISTVTSRACSVTTGWSTRSTDCDDRAASVNPGASEACNGDDDDCDGTVDEGYADADGDGWTVCSDCDDASASIHPGATDVCANGVDENCDDLYAICQASGTISLLSGYSVRYVDESTADYSGYALAVGDVTGDGVADVLTGAYQDDDGGTNAGAVYVLSGGSLSTRALAASDIKITGERAGDYAGRAVAVLDQDGDGIDDVLVGAYGNYAAGSYAGAAYVVSGPVTADRSVSTEVKLTGEDAGDWAGYEVASAGDTNDDGCDDMLVSAFVHSESHPFGGAAYLIEGPVSASGGLGTAGYAFYGEADDDELSHSLAGGGDLDGDGYDDIAIGAVGDDEGATDAGAVYVISGPITSASTLATADAKLLGAGAVDYVGWRRTLAMCGDTDADGYDDLCVGAPQNDDAGTGAGATYIFAGPVAGTIRASAADATLLGEDTGDNAGNAFHAGDVDGDGNADILLGAENADDGGSDSGAYYLLYGPFAGSVDLSAADVHIAGSHFYDNAGFSGLGADVDRDGLSDLVLGVPNRYVSSGVYQGTTYLIYGSDL